MHAVNLDRPDPDPRGSQVLGSVVEGVGRAQFLPALLAYCRDVTGASDCSMLLHGGVAPELAGAISIAGSRSHELFDWYLRGEFYRVEPSLEFTQAAQGRLLLHSLQRHELPDSRWRERYASVGLSERVSLLVALDEGWAFINAYRAPGSEVSLEDAVAAIAAQGPVVAGAVRRHQGMTRAAANDACASFAAPAWPQLSARERQVVEAILAGASAKESARLLGLSPTSVATYRQRAFDKLGIRRQLQLFQLVNGRR
jgi:DNA-binding CsgD family transcriptional regulator